jgi:hypothetical protein
MTKIANSNQSHKFSRKYKSENGRTRTSEYIRGGIRCQGGVSIPSRPVTPVTIFPDYVTVVKVSVLRTVNDWYETHQIASDPMKGCMGK